MNIEHKNNDEKKYTKRQNSLKKINYWKITMNKFQKIITLSKKIISKKDIIM